MDLRARKSWSSLCSESPLGTPISQLAACRTLIGRLAFPGHNSGHLGLTGLKVIQVAELSFNLRHQPRLAQSHRISGTRRFRRMRHRTTHLPVRRTCPERWLPGPCLCHDKPRNSHRHANHNRGTYVWTCFTSTDSADSERVSLLCQTLCGRKVENSPPPNRALIASRPFVRPRKFDRSFRSRTAVSEFHQP